jgi:hypothetical protein
MDRIAPVVLAGIGIVAGLVATVIKLHHTADVIVAASLGVAVYAALATLVLLGLRRDA